MILPGIHKFEIEIHYKGMISKLIAVVINLIDEFFSLIHKM